MEWGTMRVTLTVTSLTLAILTAAAAWESI